MYTHESTIINKKKNKIGSEFEKLPNNIITKSIGVFCMKKSLIIRER